MGLGSFIWYEDSGGQFKILLEDDDGLFYVGGDRSTPVRILTPDIEDQVFFYGITSLGPGLNEWIVSGSTNVNDEGVGLIVFVSGDGTVATQTVDGSTWQARTFQYNGGGLISTIARNGSPSTATLWQYTWHTPTDDGVSTAAYTGNLELGYVLPDILSGNRLSIAAPEILAVSTPNTDFSYAVIRGDYPATGADTNPHIVSAAGDFALLDRDLNTEMSTANLVGLTLYTSNGNFFFQSLGTPGIEAVEVTPYEIDPVTGATVQGDTFNVNYQVPSGSWRWILQASYHP